MKQVLIIVAFIFSINLIQAQVLEVETIKGNVNNNDKRINLVILSEGYQETEFVKFKTDAENLVTEMFSQSPFAEYSDYFNVHIIKVPSNESGADHPATATDTDETSVTPSFVDTYFNATFDAFGYHRYLYYGIDYADAASAEARIISVLANNFPTYHQALILVNTTAYGGTGGEFPIASLSGYDLAIHELGHSMFDLKDEYYLSNPIYYSEAINMTQETNPTFVKWKNWIDDNGINIYPYGTSGVSATWYRPHQNCKMRFLGVPFCSVCKEGIVEKIHTQVSPIDSYLPISNTFEASTFPINFQLNLIPTNNLEKTWTLNTVEFNTIDDNVSILETDLNEGSNNLTVIVHDNSPFIKVDNHYTFHVHTITWSITKSTLGIEDITSKINNLNISLFPNPANSTLNLKVESESAVNLKMSIVGIDGKLIKTTSVSNFENQQVDISHLSQGIYITNFYENNTLIASKRFVKK